MRTLNVRFRNFVSVLLLVMLVWFSGSSAVMATDWKKIGGSAAAGAVIGGITGGKSGAVLGGIAGGAGGYVWDEATRDRGRYEPRSKTESAGIIGASTVAGAAAGGAVGGKTGALIGAASGAASGYIYDRKTNNRDRRIFDRRY